MKNEFTLKLRKDAVRPTFILRELHNLAAELDSRLLFPLWTMNEAILRSMGARQIRRGVSFECWNADDDVHGNLYELPELRIGKLLFPRLKIMAVKRESQAQVLLPMALFSNLIASIDYYHHQLTITIPEGENEIRNIVVRSTNSLQVLSGEHKLPRYYEDGQLPKDYPDSNAAVMADSLAVDHEAIKKYADENGLKVSELMREEVEMFSLEEEYGLTSPRQHKHWRMSHDEQLEAITKVLEEAIEWNDALPKEDAKRLSLTELVKLRMLNPDGSIRPPWQ